MLTFAVCEAESEAPPTAREIDTHYFLRAYSVWVCVRAQWSILPYIQNILKINTDGLQMRAKKVQEELEAEKKHNRHTYADVC